MKRKRFPAKDIESLCLANAGDYPLKQQFYGLKDKLLTAYGAPDGYDLQIIEYPCYSCNGDGCCRCDKGVWDRKRWYLLRYRLGIHVFHKPVATLPPGYDQHKDLRETIKGWIRHNSVDYRMAQRAALRLMRRYQPALWLWVHKNRLGRVLYSRRVRIVLGWRRFWGRFLKQGWDRDLPF